MATQRIFKVVYKVLFLCVHNAGRSHLASARINVLVANKGLRFISDSGGTSPIDQIHPNVVSVMNEIEINISDSIPKIVTQSDYDSADKLITMGCDIDQDECPLHLRNDIEDWGIDDPKGLSIELTRNIRDQIHTKVDELINDILD